MHRKAGRPAVLTSCARCRPLRKQVCLLFDRAASRCTDCLSLVGNVVQAGRRASCMALAAITVASDHRGPMALRPVPRCIFWQRWSPCTDVAAPGDVQAAWLAVPRMKKKRQKTPAGKPFLKQADEEEKGGGGESVTRRVSACCFLHGVAKRARR